MTRGFVPGLASPHPLGDRLPAMYLEDSLVQRMTHAFDVVLAPIFSSLDNLDAYVDPELAPADFLLWLGDWVGLALDEAWPEERRRAVGDGAAGGWRPPRACTGAGARPGAWPRTSRSSRARGWRSRRPAARRTARGRTWSRRARPTSRWWSGSTRPRVAAWTRRAWRRWC